MLIYDTRRHCLVTEAGISLANAFPRHFYGVAHSPDILLTGASPASSWSAAVDDDLAASSPLMCRTVSGIVAEDAPDGVCLTILPDTLTQQFRDRTENRKGGTPCMCRIYAYGSEGVATLYAQFPVLWFGKGLKPLLT